MKFKKLVGFGDSWIWGDELLSPCLRDRSDAHPILIENTQYREENCFLGLIGRHYGLPVENFGWPGSSLQSAIWTYLWWLENSQIDPQDCLIMVGLTDAYRYSFYDPNHRCFDNDPPWNRHIHSAWIHNSDAEIDRPWKELVKLHTVLSDCDDLHRLNFRQAVEFFHGQDHGNVVQFCTMPPVIRMDRSTLIFPQTSLQGILDDFKRTDVYAPNRHPNELGHRLLSEQLISQIDHVIIS